MKIDFSFDSALCAYFMKMGVKLEGWSAYLYLGQVPQIKQHMVTSRLTYMKKKLSVLSNSAEKRSMLKWCNFVRCNNGVVFRGVSGGCY